MVTVRKKSFTLDELDAYLNQVEREKITLWEGLKAFKQEVIIVRVTKDQKEQLLQMKNLFGQSAGTRWVRCCLANFGLLRSEMKKMLTDPAYEPDSLTKAKLEEICFYLDLKKY